MDKLTQKCIFATLCETVLKCSCFVQQCFVLKIIIAIKFFSVNLAKQNEILSHLQSIITQATQNARGN